MKVVYYTRLDRVRQPSEMRFMKELSPKTLYKLYKHFQTYLVIQYG
jgi:hypothetical protein